MLWIHVLPKWLRDGVHIHPERFKYFCAIEKILGHIAEMYLAYVIILFTAFRIISILNPQETRILCSKKRANYSLLIGLLVFVLLSIPAIVQINIFDVDLGAGYPVYYCANNKYMKMYTMALAVGQIFIMFVLIIVGILSLFVACTEKGMTHPHWGRPIRHRLMPATNRLLSLL